MMENNHKGTDGRWATATPATDVAALGFEAGIFTVVESPVRYRADFEFIFILFSY